MKLSVVLRFAFISNCSRYHFASGHAVTDSSGGFSTLEMKKRTSPACDAQFEPNGSTLKTPLTGDGVAAAVISETPISAERPAEVEGTYMYTCIFLYSGNCV